MRKKWRHILLWMVVLTLAGCGNKSEEAEDTTQTEIFEGQNELTIWAWDASYNIVGASRAKEYYEKKYPEVQVDIVTMSQDDIVDRLNAGFAGKSYDGLPDVVLLEDYRIGAYLSDYPDEFRELSSIAEPEDFASYKTIMNQIDGKLYGIPFDSAVVAFFYRVDYIEEAGFTKADMKNLTWERYVEIGEKVKEATGVSMYTLDPSGLGEVRIMMQSAGEWYTDEEGNVNVADNQALKDALAIYKQMAESEASKIVTDWDQFIGAMNNGEAAGVVTGAWIASSIQNAKDQSGKWAVAACPRMESNPASVNASSLGGAGWYVLEHSRNAEEAVRFLGETFASDVNLLNQLVEDMYLVNTLHAASDCENYTREVEFFGGQKIFEELAEWSREVPMVTIGYYTYEIEDMITGAVLEVMQGEDVDAVLEEYQRKIQSALLK